MEIKKEIFKAYDIRGIYPSEVNEEMAYRLGRAFAQKIKNDSQKEKVQLLVTRDVRLSSLALKENLVKGMIDSGADVTDAGIASTPTMYFAVAKYGYDGGIQVSASHNPKEFNGFKIVGREAVAMSIETGLAELRDMVVANDFVEADKKGELKTKEDIIEDEINYALQNIDVSKIKPFRIVIDAANSVGAIAFEKLFEKLPCELIKLNFELDGTFPNHEADPLKEINNQQIQAKVLESKADLGIALDGDSDRIFFISNEGKTISPAIIRGVLAKIFLAGHEGENVCYDIRPGRITIDMIEEAGGVPVVTRVGHSLIKEKAREANAIFAGESSGHFFVKTDFGFFEEPLIITVKFLEELSKNNISLSEYIKPLDRYFHSGEINSKVEDKEKVFQALREKYGDHLQYDFDGLSFEWPDWWFNVRASNTENTMRLNLESRSLGLTAEKTKEVLGIINQK